MTPTKIMIIRHGEKPPDPPEKKGPAPPDPKGPAPLPWGVQLDGKESAKSLIVPGWQRAGALTAFFAPYQATPTNPLIATPNHIYAANPVSETQRPFETVTPLAAWLKYERHTPQFNTDFKVGGDEKHGENAMVASVLSLSGVVLICWEHKNIMPNIMSAINSSVRISNYSKIPPSWPNVFYLVWVLDLAQGTYTWSFTNQNLIFGDVPS